MGKSLNSDDRVVNLNKKVSNLRSFINKYGEQLESMTDLEIQVLILVSNRLKNPVIAKKLDLTEDEVKDYKAGIQKKLSIDAETDFEEYAVALDLIRIWFDSLRLIIERGKDTNFSEVDDVESDQDNNTGQ